MRLRFAILFGLFWSLHAQAQEAWCNSNPTNCVMSEPFQDTSYTTAASGSNYICVASGSSKPGKFNTPCNGTSGAISAQDTGSNTFAGNFSVASDPAILAGLPNRNTSAMQRYLRVPEGFASGFGAVRFGYSPITLGSARRIAIRWYAYHSPTYDFALQASCENSKLLHSSQANWGVSPLWTFEIKDATTHVYDFMSSSLNGGPVWLWSGHSGFDNFYFGAPRPGGGNGGSPQSVNNWKGKWYRFEAVVRRPRLADSSTSGWDFQFFVKNITDNTAEYEDTRFSGTCTDCAAPTGTFTWDSSIHPNADMSALHTEFYRQGTCRGWQAWAYVAMAKWDTDNTTDRIGAAAEMEGGGGGSAPSAPTNFRRTAMAD